MTDASSSTDIVHAASRHGSSGWTRQVSLTVGLMAGCAFVAGISEMLVAGVLDVIAEDIEIDLAAAGTLIFWHAIAYAIVPPLLLRRLDADRGELLAGAMCCVVVASLACATAPNLFWLATARFIQGAAGGIVLAVAIAVARQVAPEAAKGKALGIVLMGFSLALVLGVPLGVHVTEAIGWRSAFIGVAIGTLTLSGVVAWRMIVVGVPIGVSKGEFGQPFHLTRRHRVGLLVSLIWMSSYASMFSYIAPLLKDAFGLDAFGVGVAILGFGCACLVGSYLGGLLADATGPGAVAISLSMNLTAIILLLVMTPDFSAAMIFMIAWGLTSWMAVPAVQNLLTMWDDGRRSDYVLSLNNSVIQLGICAGALAGGGVVYEGVRGMALMGIGILLPAWFLSLSVIKPQGPNELEP